MRRNRRRPTVRSSHLTSRDDESILSAGGSLHVDVKFLAATGAMKVVTAMLFGGGSALYAFALP